MVMDRIRGRVSLERVDLGQTNLFDPNTETLAGTKTLVITDKRGQFLDPGGAHRDVVFPAEAVSAGAVFVICNMADAAENLVVKDDGGSTVSTIAQNEMGIGICDGTSWKAGVMAQT